MQRIFALALISATPLVGCFVPENQYDEAVHTLREEQAAHRKTAEQLYEIRQKLAFAKGKLDEEHSELSSHKTVLAQTELDLERMKTERKEATRTVDQLRGELARVGDHLRAFSEQKSDLETALGEAEERALELARLERDAETRGLLVRDVTYALHDDVSGQVAALRVARRELQVRLDAEHLFDGSVLTPEGARTIRHLAAGIRETPRARVELTEQRGPGFPAEDVIVRLQAVADVLAEAGVPFERVTLALPDEPAEGEPATFADASARIEGSHDEPSSKGETESAEAESAAPVDGAEKPTVEVTLRLAPAPEG